MDVNARKSNPKMKIILVVITVIVVAIIAVIWGVSQGALIPREFSDRELETIEVQKTPGEVSLPGVEMFPGLVVDSEFNSSTSTEFYTELFQVAPDFWVQIQPNERGGKELVANRWTVADRTTQEVTNWYLQRMRAAGYSVASPFGAAAILRVTSPEGKDYTIDVEPQGQGVSVMIVTIKD